MYPLLPWNVEVIGSNKKAGQKKCGSNDNQSRAVTSANCGIMIIMEVMNEISKVTSSNEDNGRHLAVTCRN